MSILSIFFLYHWDIALSHSKSFLGTLSTSSEVPSSCISSEGRNMWLCYASPASFLRLLFFEQICPPPAQDGASLGSRLRCPLPVVWEWEWERRSHGDSCGVPSDGAVAPNSADPGRIPAKQCPAVGGEEADEGGDRKWPQEENTQGGHSQNAADLCSKYSRWNRWPKLQARVFLSNLKYERRCRKFQTDTVFYSCTDKQLIIVFIIFDENDPILTK